MAVGLPVAERKIDVGSSAHLHVVGQAQSVETQGSLLDAGAPLITVRAGQGERRVDSSLGQSAQARDGPGMDPILGLFKKDLGR